jgi:hypothetical protein
MATLTHRPTQTPPRPSASIVRMPCRAPKRCDHCAVPLRPHCPAHWRLCVRCYRTARLYWEIKAYQESQT